VGNLGDFEPGSLHALSLDGPPIAILNLGGQLHAISDFCPHEGVTLSAGYGFIHEGTVVCMLHSSLFDVASGEVFAGPSEHGLTKYAVKIEGDEVFVSYTPESA
jgi:3-phenylpropionate/trans-cinnamate dioxygenase ferredoxin subunit